MLQPIPAECSGDIFLALDHRGRDRFKQVRHEQVARVLREQRAIRCVRTALAATLGASVLTGIVTLLLMT